MRVERAWDAILFVVGAALCFVPLFDVLGYEWCLTMALVASLAGAHVAALRVGRERNERAGSAVTAAEARPYATVAALWWRATLRVWGALALPLVCVLLNALRVKLHDRFGVDHLTIQMEMAESADDTFHFCHAGTDCYQKNSP